MMQDVGVCLFGISYNESYRHWQIRKPVTVDYRYSLSNYKEHIFDQLQGYKVYLSTYDHPLLRQMIQDYGASKTTVSPASGMNILTEFQRNTMVINLNRVIGDHEWYIITRFDLLLNVYIKDLKPEKDKINVLAELEKPGLICDNFYIVHRSMIKFFFNSINKYIYSYRHNMRMFDNKVHLLTEEKGKYVKDMSCYRLRHWDQVKT